MNEQGSRTSPRGGQTGVARTGDPAALVYLTGGRRRPEILANRAALGVAPLLAITVAPLASAQSAAAAPAAAESGITKRQCQAAGGTGITPIQDGYEVIRFECNGGTLAGETLTNADVGAIAPRLSC